MNLLLIVGGIVSTLVVILCAYRVCLSAGCISTADRFCEECL